MNMIRNGALKGLACSVSALALVVGGPAWAQNTTDTAGDPVDQADGTCATDATGAPISTDPDCADVSTESTTADSGEGAIIVTGSRIKRDTYTSVSPLQVLSTDTENEAGLFDPSQILQRSESATGQQIDATFQGFVLDNGPGSQTINLRGLGADRTLLLVNGRRLAPAGVEGAPSAPSINLLPGTLIERYELLLDGASSVYGSDAVAGVGNIILKKDFDGLELSAQGDINPMGAGEDYTVGAAWGKNLDRGFFGVGIEYAHRDTVRLRDRDFFRGCARHIELTDTGEIRTTDIASNAIVRARTPGVGVIEQDCVITSQVGRIIVPGTYFGNLFFQPSIANSGVPNFSAFRDAFGRDVDRNGDGQRDVDFPLGFNRNGADETEVFISEQNLLNVMAYGEYTLEGAANITPFFEANYSRARIISDNTGAPQLFPFVPASNPTNPCNRTATGGVDCRLQNNRFEGFLPGTPNARFALPTGTSLAVQPVLAIQGDRDNVNVLQEQYRGVLGVRGDLPFIGSDWTFETAFVYSRSEGRAVRRGIREDKLAFALGLDPTADYNNNGVFDNDGDGIADDYIGSNTAAAQPLTGGACNAAGLRNPGAALPDLLQGCVPVNLFAPSAIGSPVGQFATQAEADYLFGLRTFDTTYQQMTGSAFVTGNLFRLPAGPVGAVVGVEIREDKINSQPDVVASNGLLYGFFVDRGARGSKMIKEAFGELDIPLQAGKAGVRELNLNLSGRVTDEEFYGTNFTYAVKAGWRPIDPLLLKFSYGTSFRAPNLRENFLAGQSGFLTLFDPCAVPAEAFNALRTPQYDPGADTREANTLENCRREGRDPTTVGTLPTGTNTQQTTSVEITSGGSLDIDPETSRSITTGFAFEETFGGVDVSLGFNYFDIKLKDSIIEPSSQFIINDCFTRTDGIRSPFCDRITVDPTGRALISDVFSGFINLNEENVRGMDFNATFGKEVTLFGNVVDLGLNLRANRLIERSTTFIDDAGTPTFDDDAGEFFFPEWTGRGTFTADIDKFRFTWQVSYTGPVEQDEDDIDPFSDAFGRGPDGQPTGVIGDTCTGGGSRNAAGVPNGIVPGDGAYCRDVGFAKEQFLHTASLRYRTDRYTLLVGVSNIFNTPPPRVDGTEVLSIANTALGAGYDYDGREFFGSINFKF